MATPDTSFDFGHNVGKRDSSPKAMLERAKAAARASKKEGKKSGGGGGGGSRGSDK